MDFSRLLASHAKYVQNMFASHIGSNYVFTLNTIGVYFCSMYRADMYFVHGNPNLTSSVADMLILCANGYTENKLSYVKNVTCVVLKVGGTVLFMGADFKEHNLV